MNKCITFLGTGGYQSANYLRGKFSCSSVYSQTALSNYLKTVGTVIEEMIVFVTAEAFAKHGETFKKEIHKHHPDMKVRFVRHSLLTEDPDLWDFFELLNAEFEGDHHYWLEITHAFRSVPFLSLLSAQFSAFLNNSSIEGIFYGQFDKETLEGRIVDLTMLLQLGEWTAAIRAFKETGNPNPLIQMENEEKRRVLPHLTGEERGLLSFFQIGMHISRLTSAIEMARQHTIRKEVDRLKEKMEAQRFPEIQMFRPYRHLFRLLQDSFTELFEAPDEIALNEAVVRWCIKYRLYPQAYILLVESLYTETCRLYQLDPSERKARTAIKNVFTKDGKNHLHYPVEPEYETIQKHLDEVLLPKRQVFQAVFSDLNDKRNNFMHAGMNKDAVKDRTLRDSIVDFLPTIIDLQRHIETGLNARPIGKE